jgi:hypothetical protein
MVHRVRLASVVAGLMALAGAVGVQSSHAAAPPLTLSVNLGGTLEAVLGNGTKIRSTAAPGAVIPPGSYLILVNSDVPDSRDIFHLFHLSGPGVNVSSDLLPCENPRPLYAVTLLPSSTYTYEDSRNPQLAPIVFSTSATGSSADTNANLGGPATGKSQGTTSNTSVLGTDGKAPFRGTLLGTVSPAGALSLSHNGKAVSSLKSGRYRIAVDDRASSGGFTIEKLHTRGVLVTGSRFVGRHTVTLELKPGKWMFFSSAAQKHQFAVVA